MEKIYNKAYTEILEILKYLPEESRNKIPSEMLEMFKIKHDKNYKFVIDIDKSFKEQDLLDETKAILANIFRDYWATPYQREQILAKEIYDRQKLEEENLSMKKSLYGFFSFLLFTFCHKYSFALISSFYNKKNSSEISFIF